MPQLSKLDIDQNKTIQQMNRSHKAPGFIKTFFTCTCPETALLFQNVQKIYFRFDEMSEPNEIKWLTLEL